MTAVPTTSTNCLSNSSSSSSIVSMASRRSPKGSHSPHPVESPLPQESAHEQQPQQQQQQLHDDRQQQWQERSSGLGEPNVPSPSQQPAELGDAAAAASAVALRPFGAHQGTQQQLEVLQQAQGTAGIQGSAHVPGRPALVAKTSSLVQRKQQFYK
ncbi:hypothetical protein EMWEY_00058590, partial [Eimeria maxima]